MPHRTDIEWTDYSQNPLRAIAPDGRKGHACVKISPGCAACYAQEINNRFGTQRDYTAGNMKDIMSHYLDEKEMKHTLTFKPKPPYKNDSTRPRVFPFDMTDIFGEWVSDEIIDRVMATYAMRPDVDFLVLTKRADRMHRYWTTYNRAQMIDEAKTSIMTTMKDKGRSVDAYVGEEESGYFEHGYLANVWHGVSAETQKYADERVPLLLKTPAARRFVSAEPLLGPIDFKKYLPGWCDTCEGTGTIIGAVCYGGKPTETEINCPDCVATLPSLDLIIPGGESGPQARQCDVHWIRSIVQQCSEAEVSCFVKQIGSKPTTSILTRPEGEESYWTTLIKDSKGGDPEEWPIDLRVRQMPRSAV